MIDNKWEEVEIKFTLKYPKPEYKWVFQHNMRGEGNVIIAFESFCARCANESEVTIDNFKHYVESKHSGHYINIKRNGKYEGIKNW